MTKNDKKCKKITFPIGETTVPVQLGSVLKGSGKLTATISVRTNQIQNLVWD
jgi:hypothetical protein